MEVVMNHAQYLLIVPTLCKTTILEKITEIWSKATVKEVESLPTFSLNSTNYSLSYRKHDGLSLNVDKKSNKPLNTILNVMIEMKEQEEIIIAYNFMPISQIGWKADLRTVKFNILKNITKDIFFSIIRRYRIE